MRIAILGGTSHIARATTEVLCRDTHLTFDLYARNPDDLTDFIARLNADGRVRALPLYAFVTEDWDVAFNAIGAGDPSRIQDMGADIFRLTEQYDNLVLDALNDHPERLYLFLSSGAVYGPGLDAPATESNQLTIDVNQVDQLSPYALAKLHAEAKHRAMTACNIVDLRVFGFFSRHLAMSGQFFLAELMRSLVQGTPFITGPADMVRDTITPDDFATLIHCILQAWQGSPQPLNISLDVYSKAPAGKFEVLEALRDAFAFDFVVDQDFQALTPTGAKPCYASAYKRASDLGYEPSSTSVEGIVKELRARLDT